MKKLILSAFIVSLIGCAPSVKFIRTGKVYTPLTNESQVTMVLENEAVPKHEQIGIAMVQGPENDYAEILEGVRKKAISAGGNVVIFKEKKISGFYAAGTTAGVLYDYRFIIGRIKGDDL